MRDEPTRDDLIQMEEGFWGAAGDAQFYRDHFAEDGRCVFGFGVLDKAETITSIASAPPWTSVAFDDVELTTIAADVASLSYAARADRDGDRYDAIVSSVYVNREGSWKMVLHQQTPT